MLLLGSGLRGEMLLGLEVFSSSITTWRWMPLDLRASDKASGKKNPKSKLIDKIALCSLPLSSQHFPPQKGPLRRK